MTTTTRDGVTTTDRSGEVQKPHFLTSSYCWFHPFPHHNRIELGGHVSFSDWIVCWHFTQCELCQGCMSVLGDFNILFGSPSSRHPSPDVRCSQFEWLRVLSLFLHFSVCRHHCFESFYERHLFLIANFTPRIRRGTIIFAGMLEGYLYCMFPFWHLMSLMCCQVPMCYCTGTYWWKHWARPRHHIWM